MRVASEETLERAIEVRRSGKSWLEISKDTGSRESGLKFFRGAGSSHVPLASNAQGRKK